MIQEDMEKIRFTFVSVEPLKEFSKRGFLFDES
jgi:hypothetical protein